MTARREKDERGKRKEGEGKEEKKEEGKKGKQTEESGRGRKKQWYRERGGRGGEYWVKRQVGFSEWDRIEGQEKNQWG